MSMMLLRKHLNVHTEDNMLRKFIITYITVTGKEKTEKIEALSKYDAKQRFYRLHPKYEIIKVEEIQ